MSEIYPFMVPCIILCTDDLNCTGHTQYISYERPCIKFIKANVRHDRQLQHYLQLQCIYIKFCISYCNKYLPSSLFLLHDWKVHPQGRCTSLLGITLLSVSSCSFYSFFMPREYILCTSWENLISPWDFYLYALGSNTAPEYRILSPEPHQLVRAEW